MELSSSEFYLKMAMEVMRCSGRFPTDFRLGRGSFGRLGDASKLCVESRRSCDQMWMVLRLAHSHSLGRHLTRAKLCDWISLREGKASSLGLKQAFHEENSGYKLPALALFLANIMMLVEPLEAHAETCETTTDPMFTMPILLAVALVGATVGGLLARQRKGELQRVNEQLRQINTALRRQAKIESYAPSLSYAPVGKVVESEVIVDPKKQELVSRLKAGKSFLRSQNPEKAFFEFKAALELAQNLKDPIEEKKAARGLGASLQRQGKYQEAIKYHSMVLDISKREGEHSGSTEAFGAIADCYTELGDLEQAGKYYDRYIERLESD